MMNTKSLFNSIIAIVWAIVFLSPLAFHYFLEVSDGIAFNKFILMREYTHRLAFLVLFVLHHFVFLPYLLQRKRNLLYVLAVVVSLVCFWIFLIKTAPPPFFMLRKVHQWMLTPADLARMVIAFLMLGVDMGVDAMMKARAQKRRLAELETQNLKHELEYLKHQINPHFFMNSLNNIHALIGIDPERAMRSVVEMSKIMRYVLYDVSEPMVKLSGEIDFIEQYISLMKLRFRKNIEILCNLPKVPEKVTIPPLLLITFIENAFKHGISYQQQSYIHINLEMKDDNQKICFYCKNSNFGKAKTIQERGGIGLENVRKRLNLIYNKEYDLRVDDTNPEEFNVTLVIPAYDTNKKEA